MTRPASPRRCDRWRRSGTLVLVALALAGCGITPDSSPRDIPADLQAGLDRPLTDQPTEGTSTRVFLIDAEAPGQTALLRGVGRNVIPTATAVMESLLSGPTEGEQSRRLRTAIPSDTTLLSARFASRTTLTVDLSDQIFEATGDLLIDAVAQLVFTASEIEGVQRVEIRVDGELQEWPRGDGSLASDPLTVFDFPGRAASSQPDYPAVAAISVAD